MSATTPRAFAMSTDALLDHWLGHRRVTRRMIEAFPEDSLFRYSIGGMRPFAELAMEMIGMCSAGIRGVATGEWVTDVYGNATPPKSRPELLARWDAVTEQIQELWPTIPPERFEEVDTAFGQWEGVVYALLFYWIDNEIHHRGQGYVYLRALGIEPPPFYDRT